MNHSSDFNSTKIISKPTFKRKLNFLEIIQIKKNFDSIVNCELTILSLLDCWKYHMKSLLF